MPCTDFDIASSSDATEYVRECNHQEHENHQDFCSPFCACNCCGQAMATTNIYKLYFPQPIIHNFKSQTAFFYAFDWTSQFLTTIFQPPRLLS